MPAGDFDLNTPLPPIVSSQPTWNTYNNTYEALMASGRENWTANMPVAFLKKAVGQRLDDASKDIDRLRKQISEEEESEDAKPSKWKNLASRLLRRRNHACQNNTIQSRYIYHLNVRIKWMIWDQFLDAIGEDKSVELNLEDFNFFFPDQLFVRLNGRNKTTKSTAIGDAS